MAALAVVAVFVAGVIVIGRDDAGGIGLSALPGATGQPPTGPTGGAGSGDGMGGPPFPMQPPGMPDGPSGYSSGTYPAPDQGNGISLYNPDEQSAGSQGAPGRAPGYGQQQLQPANGTQPPDYDASVPPTAGQSAAPSPHTADPQASQQPPRATSPQQPANPQPTDQSPEPRTPAPTSAPESSVAPTPTKSPTNDSDQEQQRDNYRCLNASPVIQFSSMKGQLTIALTDGGQCNSCDTEKPRENPNNCSKNYVEGVGIRPADPRAEGGLESIEVYPTRKARMDALGSGAAILFADTPPELKQAPADIGQGAASAYTMWGDILCHAQASQLMSPSDPTKSLYDRIEQNPDSIFQQYMCHFFGVQKKFWDAEGGYAKPSWNFEWARPAKGTSDFVFRLHPCN